MKNLIYSLILISFLFSCSNNDEKKNAIFSTTNDMDNSVMWINTNTIVKGTAHSGFFSSKLDSTKEFGIGLGSKFENFNSKLPKKVFVKLWVYSLVPNLDAAIVCDPNINGKSLKYQSYSFVEPIKKANEWIEVKTSFDMPSNITPNTELKVYIWNPKKHLFYIDDMEVWME